MLLIEVLENDLHLIKIRCFCKCLFLLEMEENIMFVVGFILGLVLGANISLFLYALILIGKQSDEIENIREKEV